MSEPFDAQEKHKMEILIGNLLRTGVITAASVVFLGGVIYLVRHGLEFANYKVFQREPVDLCTVAGIIKRTFLGRGRGMIQLGLLLLILTPVARVALSIFAFMRERDKLYVILTLIVFGILTYSLLGR